MTRVWKVSFLAQGLEVSRSTVRAAGWCPALSRAMEETVVQYDAVRVFMGPVDGISVAVDPSVPFGEAWLVDSARRVVAKIIGIAP